MSSGTITHSKVTEIPIGGGGGGVGMTLPRGFALVLSTLWGHFPALLTDPNGIIIRDGAALWRGGGDDPTT